MSPTIALPFSSGPQTSSINLSIFSKRYCTYSYTGYQTCYDSGWYDYGRWILLGVIVFVFFVFFFGCSCLSRRRRRRNQQPFYGTGWMAHGVEPAPPYTQGNYNPNTKNTGNSYPMNTTTSNNNAYAPPVGPPPGQQQSNGYYGNQGQETGYAAPQKPMPTYGAGYGNNSTNAGAIHPNYTGGSHAPSGGEYMPPQGPPPGRY